MAYSDIFIPSKYNYNLNIIDSYWKTIELYR